MGPALNRIDTLLNSSRLEATQWERKFLISIRSQVDDSERDLSPNQLAILVRIEEKNSPKRLQEIEEWLNEWDAERQEIARVVALYYQRELYFTNLASKILESGYVPSAKEYQKICENKYALKVREEHFKSPLYKVNSFVQVRKSISVNKHYIEENGGPIRIQNMFALVLETDALPVRRAAQGAKVYKILPVGSARSYYVSESDIKKAKKFNK